MRKRNLRLNFWRQWLIFLVAGLIVGLAFRPLLHNTFFPLHDYTHVARLSEMHRALVDGYLPVRWSKNLGFGYGMPLFNFYAPLFYYVAEIKQRHTVTET